MKDTKYAAKKLRDAATFLETHDWCRGSEALDVEKNDVEPHAASACRWCAVGAIGATTKHTVRSIDKSFCKFWGCGPNIKNEGLERVQAIVEDYDFMDSRGLVRLSTFNDDRAKARGKRDVIRYMRKVAKILENEDNKNS